MQEIFSQRLALCVALCVSFTGLAAAIAAPNAGQGFMEQAIYLSSTDCSSKASAYITSASSLCVKIFGGPQDPTTELTSYKISVQESDDQLSLSKAFYKDASCSVPNGKQAFRVFENDCLAFLPNGMMYSNMTAGGDMPPPAVSAGVTVTGFNEYSTCSNNKHPTWRLTYPNDACVPEKGKTPKDSQEYLSYSLSCSGTLLTQTFFTDPGCVQTVGVASHKLGGADSTCYTNEDATSDINLFETMQCIGAPADAEVAGEKVVGAVRPPVQLRLPFAELAQAFGQRVL